VQDLLLKFLGRICISLPMSETGKLTSEQWLSKMKRRVRFVSSHGIAESAKKTGDRSELEHAVVVFPFLWRGNLLNNPPVLSYLPTLDSVEVKRDARVFFTKRPSRGHTNEISLS
jgi:hypothetical protein